MTGHCAPAVAPKLREEHERRRAEAFALQSFGSGNRRDQLSGEVQLLTQVYDRFNARDLEATLAAIHPGVQWANGMEGGYVHGREAVRDYWTRQWGMIDPHVEPVGFSTRADGRVVVAVHQMVRDLAGKVLVDQMVSHVFLIEDGQICRFDIGEH